jgi:hypothetical protein
MSYQYLYCSTCGQRRVAMGFRCSVCNGPVRHSERPQRLTTGADAGHDRFTLGWRRHVVAGEPAPAPRVAA